MKSFIKGVKKNILPLVYSSTLVMGGTIGYFSIVTQKNRKQFEEEQENDEFYKDMTRDSNAYYGINWGFRADQLISDKIDAGDLFLLKYDCNECLQLNDIIKCKYLQLSNHEQDYDSIGFAFRDATGLYIIANQFGKTQIQTYQDFLAQPFLKEISLRKIILKDANNTVNRAFYKLVKQHFSKLQKSGDIQESAEEMAFNYMKALGIVKREILQDENDKFVPKIASYDDSNPFFLEKLSKFDSKIIVRSKTNKELRRQH